MRISIMQPYIFPYIGYFHLIEATDKIIFYDDVNYIKSGWINRNRILLNGKELLFTIPLSQASSFKHINEISPIIDDKWKNKFYKTLEQCYKKAPFYNEVIELIKRIFSLQYNDVTDLCINSISAVYTYLGKNINYTKSSVSYNDTIIWDKAYRLIEITKRNNAKEYVNPIGGFDLYDKGFFKEQGIELFFVKSQFGVYKQFDGLFVPGLSIIDALMFNSKDEIKELFTQYELV